MNLKVRKAFKSDRQEISDIVIAAFGDVQGQEVSDLITDLLADSSARPLVSLVATIDDTIVGYILFTNAHIKHFERNVSSAILAPLSVHPEFQNLGIGGRLIKEGLKKLKTMGVELVFVLGHPSYYPKYGFSIAGINGFDAPYPISPENSGAWMVQELHAGTVEDVSGQVICAEALNDPKYWRE